MSDLVPPHGGVSEPVNRGVPDYMTFVKEAGFCGWPYSYFGQLVDPRVQPQRADLVAKAIVPDYALGVAGACIQHGHGFARQLSRRCIHRRDGSWNRDVLNGYKVVYVPFSDGKPSGMAQDVVTGFLNSDNQARGRPVGVASTSQARS